MFGILQVYFKIYEKTDIGHYLQQLYTLGSRAMC